MATKRPRGPSKQPKKSKARALTARSAGTINWDHPAGYHVGGKRLANLKEVVEPATPTISLTELTDQQRTELVIARLELLPDDFHSCPKQQVGL